MTTVVSPYLTKNADRSAVVSGRDLVAFDLREVPSARWCETFSQLWQSQSGPQGLASWRPKARFCPYRQAIFIDVTGFLDTKWSGPGGVPWSVAENFQPWLERYIDFTNAAVRKEEAEEKLRAEREAEQDAARLKKLRGL